MPLIRRSAPLHDLFPAQPFDQESAASPVATLDNIVPETPEEAQNLDIQIRQAEARRIKAQKALDDRAKRAADELARELADQQALTDASAELQRLRDREAAERAAQERGRVAQELAEWEQSGAMTDLLKFAVAAHEERTKHTDPVEQARTIFTQRFGVAAPPVSAWARDGLMFEVRILNGQVIAQCDIRPGQESYGITLFGVNEPIPGVAAITVQDKADLGMALAEYVAVSEFFGLTDADLPEPQKLDGSGINIEAFGAQSTGGAPDGLPYGSAAPIAYGSPWDVS